MKLITKFILIYLTVTVFVLGIGGVISYYIIQDEVDKELQWEFLERIDRVTYLLEQGRRFNPRRNIEGDRNLIIQELDYPVEDRVEVTDTLIWHNRLEQNEQNVKVSAYRDINGSPYFISTYGAMIESDDIREAVVKTLLWIIGLQVVGALGIGYFISGRLFKPFRKTLDRIRNFDLHQKEILSAEETSVAEFTDLNRFIEQMTRKAVSDYKNLKEFSENASHELQTPLAIAKGKLELLTESNLTEEQYRYVESLERSIKKLSRLSESLSILTKIENYEFINDQTADLSKLITESIEEFREFIIFNKIEIETDIQENVSVQMHPALTEIMWTNLFQNAIKHNIPDGTIKVILNPNELIISNTGKPLSVNPDQLFERFRKDDQNSSSIGLGLSIVERIAHQNQFNIDYTSKNEWHTIRIELNPVKPV